MSARPLLVLASASPRRSALLLQAGVEFEVRASRVAEHLDPGWSPEEAARSLALAKAREVAAGWSGARPACVLGADTIVAVPAGDAAGARILGKPADEREAAEFLRLLSGSRHEVVTGFAWVPVPEGREVSGCERTWVTMRPLEESEVAAYVASGEWRDKAGGYAIQETADRFVTRLEGGGFDNVVGLPVQRVLAALRGIAERSRDAERPPRG